MILNTSNVNYSNIDLVKKIKIPNVLTLELAYLTGVHLGEGSMIYNKEKYDSWIAYSGNLIEEYDWYINYLIPLLKTLFNINPSIQEDRRIKRSMIRIYFRSKAILDFLHRVIGLPLGNKKGCSIPKTIIKANNKIKRNFLKGLADTEFSLRFSKKTTDGRYAYPAISYGTSNTNLAKSINSMLLTFGFKTYSRFGFRTWRNNTHLISNYIYLNGSKNLEKWMKEIGFSSPKHLTKYQIWKGFNHCPPNTTLNDRKAILKGNLDINSFYSNLPYSF